MADRALLTGINDYASISDLRGCENDVHNIKRLLTETCGFDTRNVHELINDAVTKERIEDEWRWLLDGALPGDRLVFHFSGHGSQNVDRDGDESDGVDELLCLHDMDWDDDRTYLLDDDLRRFTERVPSGVRLTVILDNCHSGTGTRLLFGPGGTRSLAPEKTPEVDLRASLGRLDRRGSRGSRRMALSAQEAADATERILAPRTRDEARNAVLVRFAAPPPKVLAAMHRFGVRSTVARAQESRDETAMNHVLFAGSRSDQTSADAYIDNDFHGAFTYHLCKIVRDQGADVDHEDLIRKVGKAIRDGGFSQVPQLEPEGTRGPFLGYGSGSSDGNDHGGGKLPSRAGGEVRDLVRKIDELIDVLTPLATDRADRGPRVRGGEQHLVYVHGICAHDEGYSDGWFDALRKHLPEDLERELAANRREVLWSDLVTPASRERAAIARELTSDEQDLAAEIRDILEDRTERQAIEALPEQSAVRPDERGLTDPRDSRSLSGERALFGIPGLDCVDDFAKYLLDNRIRRDVMDRLLAVVEPLLSRDGATVHVVSHSWGTVVAYEALRTLDSMTARGEVGTLFTVGSALSIPPVKRRLRPRDGRKPRRVQRWVNIDAKGDIVGGPLKGRPFDVDTEFLNLRPTGCKATFGVYPPACAHSSYFHSDNTAVNRDIFGRHLRD